MEAFPGSQSLRANQADSEDNRSNRDYPQRVTVPSDLTSSGPVRDDIYAVVLAANAGSQSLALVRAIPSAWTYWNHKRKKKEQSQSLRADQGGSGSQGLSESREPCDPGGRNAVQQGRNPSFFVISGPFEVSGSSPRILVHLDSRKVGSLPVAVAAPAGPERRMDRCARADSARSRS